MINPETTILPPPASDANSEHHSHFLALNAETGFLKFKAKD
jgi:hypothetical protein